MGAGDLLLFVGNRNVSSWSMRAWLALVEKGVSFDERLVDLRGNDAPQAAQLASLSPPARVPVLLHGGLCIYDSLAIMEYANEAFAGPELMPGSPAGRAKARSLMAWMHAGFSALREDLSFESTFHPRRPAASERAVAEARVGLAAFEDALAHSGGPYLFGAVGLADLTFVPLLRRLRAYGVSFVGFPRAAAWEEALRHRESVRRWTVEAEALPPA